PASLQRFLNGTWIVSIDAELSSSVVLFVQKLPPSVKNGKSGSARPIITLPHMHDKTGCPSSSRICLPSSFRQQR
ncbi:MAG: hypothetical protein ACYSU5_21950, partial [Planctomycetota bacterium]